MKRNNEDRGSNQGFRGDRDGGGGGGGFGGGGGGGGEKRSFQKRKGCRFCSDTELLLDYKDKNLFQQFVTERFKIVPRRISGNCAGHQRQIAIAVKRARHIALIPYTTAQF